MIVVNFAHPMTKDQLKAIEHLTGQAIEGGVAVRAQVNLGWPIAPHVKDLVDQCGLSGGREADRAHRGQPAVARDFSRGGSRGVVRTRRQLPYGGMF